MVELDVLWTPQGKPSAPLGERAPLVIAHDWHDAQTRDVLTLEECLDAFTKAPLDGVDIDLDIKLPGREDEIAAAIRNSGITERVMFSTMETSTVEAMKRHIPELRRGWTFPKVTKDWTSRWWAAPAVFSALIGMRRRLPGIAKREIERMDLSALWVFHPIVTARLAEVTREAGAELYAWTVDDLPTMRRLAADGVAGICSNDPRLFDEL